MNIDERRRREIDDLLVQVERHSVHIDALERWVVQLLDNSVSSFILPPFTVAD